MSHDPLSISDISDFFEKHYEARLPRLVLKDTPHRRAVRRLQERLDWLQQIKTEV
jgi:hypothetical protein